MSRDEGLEKKLFKLPGGREFSDEVIRLSIPQLEARISSLQKQLDESEEHMKNNEALNQIKAEKKELEGPYRDVRSAVKLKTKYLIELIKEKGGN